MKEAEDLSRHDKWLYMMFPRLQLLRQFLRSDGLILISIDDHEIHRLRCLMDEIFGTSNFIAQLVWDKTRKNDAKLFSVGHEYMVIYARSLSTLRKLKTIWRESKPGADEILIKYKEIKEKYNNSDYPLMEEELRVWHKSLPKNHPSQKLSRYKHIDALGVWRDRDISWPGGGGPRYLGLPGGRGASAVALIRPGGKSRAAPLSLPGCSRLGPAAASSLASVGLWTSFSAPMTHAPRYSLSLRSHRWFDVIG